MNKREIKQQIKMRPYEKMMQFGAENLTEMELLAIILRTGTKEKNAEELAGQILELTAFETMGFTGLHRISLQQLRGIHGVGQVKAIQIKCVMELCTRVAKSKAKDNLTFQKSGSVASYYMESLRYKKQECVMLLLLDTKGHLIKETELTKGTVKASLLSPREIFIEAVKAEAVNMILLHNHPSGDATPSPQDINVTAKINELGNKMDIPLIDHIIIGDNTYYSFKEQGYL